MAISRLAISNPSATTDTLLYTADRSSLASIIATNKASTVAEVRVWVIPTGQDATPANWSYIAYDADITATNSLETFRFPVMTGDKIYVRSTTADVSFQIMGIYETGADTYVYAQATQPTAPQIGDIWVDTSSNVPSIDNTTVYRWSKTATGGETSLSGAGDDSSTLQYISGYEQVYLNGVLLAKGLDYTASNGTSITSLVALVSGDIVEVISPYAIELTDVYTKSVSDSKYQTKVANGLNLVIPSSVTNGTIAANGEITVGSTVTSIVVGGAFSATYDNYEIIWTGGVMASSSGDSQLSFQLTGSSTGYNNILRYSNGSTMSVASQSNAAQWNWIGGGSTGSGLMQIKLFAPFLSVHTRMSSCAYNAWNNTAFGNADGVHTVASSYTGFTLSVTGTGSMTGGKIRIYGYNNGGA